MTVREAALKALQAGKALTTLRLAAMTGAHEHTCGQVLKSLRDSGIAQRRPIRGKKGQPLQEYFIADAKPACCPHCGGEL